MNIAFVPDTDLNGPLPDFLTEGREPGPAAVTYIGKRARETSVSCSRQIGCDSRPLCESYGKCKADHTSVETPRGPDLKKLESELSRNPLDEIAAAVRALTFGEMHELAHGIWGARPGDVIESDALPGMLHKWSEGRK